MIYATGWNSSLVVQQYPNINFLFFPPTFLISWHNLSVCRGYELDVWWRGAYPWGPHIRYYIYSIILCCISFLLFLFISFLSLSFFCPFGLFVLTVRIGEPAIVDVWNCLREGEAGFTYDYTLNKQIKDTYRTRLDRVFAKSTNSWIFKRISHFLLFHLSLVIFISLSTLQLF